MERAASSDFNVGSFTTLSAKVGVVERAASSDFKVGFSTTLSAKVGEGERVVVDGVRIGISSASSEAMEGLSSLGSVILSSCFTSREHDRGASWSWSAAIDKSMALAELSGSPFGWIVCFGTRMIDE